nr:immunoglobulin heavy chain junction region [Macaca mulatta]MOV87052.1 immunoglobulin heavy chain junction region [Macaca mulatta]MOV87975.1 immunoglobulin heavy chain junction region [Macaca mulatta]MOV87993.1 immunoglobulin heavy chain junction region [Macaca mulatta]MOV89008.1 immunoglobulin heavy chain junction region [Macaca mulatta]
CARVEGGGNSLDVW